LTINRDVLVDFIDDLKELKLEYERLRDQYLQTRNPQHYILYQKAFRAYRSYIDRYNISSRRIIDSFPEGSTTDNDGKVAYDYPLAVSPSLKKPQRLRPRTFAAQKKILDILSTRRDFTSISAIIPYVSLGKSQIRRHLYQLHEQGLLEQQEIDGIFFWRKKRDI